MARFRTAGRGCESIGVSTCMGWTSKPIKYPGKRLIKIDKIERVSMRVSGGVLGWGAFRERASASI